MEHYRYYEYLKYDGEDFFTMVLLPEKIGRFPLVVCRSPYAKRTVDMAEDDILQEYYNSNKAWLEHGYAVVFQHCRGQGKSTGEFVPYVHEREDGLAFREWIRKQPFYNGELYLLGGSYTASLHYVTAPFENDIKGAVFEMQDSERYRLWYRNGQMRKGHANWHFVLYKDKCGLNKRFSIRSFSALPLKGLSERVLGDCAEDFEQMLEAPRITDGFWSTRFGGADARDAVSRANIPILLTTGYNDFYVGGVFKMWEQMDGDTKKKSALLVSPYNHGDGYNKDLGLFFQNGKKQEEFGADYQIAWFDNIRNGSPISFEKGVITYYRTFENKWQSDFYKDPVENVAFLLGEGVRSFKYDPQNPCAFREEGLFAEMLDERQDVVSIYTEKFDNDTFVKGKMQLKLVVESDCPDTAFYVRISIKKSQYTYVLRHDITSLCYQLGDYQINQVVDLEFNFDDYAFLIEKGDCLRIDISSTDDNVYVCHTNRRGEYYLQDGSDVAINKIHLDRSCLILPIEHTTA